MSTDIFTAAILRAEAGDLAGAEGIYRAAVKAGADDPRIRMCLGQLLLLRGDYRRGLPLYEHRYVAPFPGRRWRGQPLRGQTVLVRGEQGYGDNFQFIRFAEPLAERGARVVIGSRGGLGRLLAGAPGVAGVVEDSQAMAPPDLVVPMMSLPYLLGTTLETIPARRPYLTADPALTEAWRTRLAPHSGLKVGLVWGGNPQAPHDGRRSPGLDPYLTLSDVPGITVFSLQKGPWAEMPAGRVPPGAFIDLGPDLTDFDQTAAAMQGLDLVISCCTSTAHLAGALGRPVWVVLSAFPDWRWLLEREDSPWYPTARLFRAGLGEGWGPVLGRVRQALAEKAMTGRG